jgi:hypothetical protein
VCAAKFDENWFRGIVKDYDESDSTATIFFVDWGNTAKCSTKDLRILEMQFIECPVLATPFSLHGVKPHINEDHWIDEDSFPEFENKKGTLTVRPHNKTDTVEWPLGICKIILEDVRRFFTI